MKKPKRKRMTSKRKRLTFVQRTIKKKEFTFGLLALILSSIVLAAFILSMGDSSADGDSSANGSGPQQLAKPPSTGPVQISDGKLMVNGQPFFVKGVAYGPTPIGYSYAYNFIADSGIYNRDFPLLRAMHCNVIRTWTKITSTGFLDAAYNNGVDPIYVIMGFYIEPYNVSNPTYRVAIVNEFREYVRTYKDHPAVLMWAPGNEIDYEINKIWPDNENRIKDWYTLLNELAKTAYEVEGNAYHPVITSNWEIIFIGEPSVGSDDNSMSFLDAWGATSFRGRSFEGLFHYYSGKSSKPLLITEFGIDAWDTVNQAEDEATQADYAAALWDEIVEASDVALGGCVMGYSDVWWMAGDASSHDYGGDEMPSFPDGYNNQEWWGIVRVTDNGTGPDIVEPRTIYYTLQQKWAE